MENKTLHVLGVLMSLQHQTGPGSSPGLVEELPARRMAWALPVRHHRPELRHGGSSGAGM